MTWLTVTEYICHRWPWLWSNCRKNFMALSLYMTYHRICNWSNTSGVVTSGEETIYPSGAHEFTPGVWWGSCCSWSLRCLSFDVRFLITTLVSPNVFSITWLNKCRDYYYDNSESRMINKFYTCIKNKR